MCFIRNYLMVRPVPDTSCHRQDMCTNPRKSLDSSEEMIGLARCMLLVAAEDTNLAHTNEPLFFETPFYKSRFCVGDSEEPHELLNPNIVSSVPNLSHISSPYLCEIKHMKVLGFMKPYPLALFDESYREKGMPSAVEVHYRSFIRKAITEFASLDRSWGQYHQTDMIKKAMALTKKLNSLANRRYQVLDFDFQGKSTIALALDLGSTPGLPFAADPTQKFQFDCLDRGFKLAIEISDSARKNPPRKVKAPPCIYGIRQTECSGMNGECVYPMALQILERKFFLDSLKKGYPDTPNDPFPSLYLRNQGASRDKLILEPDYCLVVRFESMDLDMHPDLINFALVIIQKWIVMKPEDAKVWEFLKYYLISTPVVFPSGQLVRKQGGTTSDSILGELAKCVIKGFIGIYGMLSQGLSEEDIKGKVHCKNRELIMAVPRTFSEHKFIRDVENDLGFKVGKFISFDNKNKKVVIIRDND